MVSAFTQALLANAVPTVPIKGTTKVLLRPPGQAHAEAKGSVHAVVAQGGAHTAFPYGLDRQYLNRHCNRHEPPTLLLLGVLLLLLDLLLPVPALHLSHCTRSALGRRGPGRPAPRSGDASTCVPHARRAPSLTRAEAARGRNAGAKQTLGGAPGDTQAL